jgi:hypothetical protein
MNTANLQMQGVLLALASLCHELRRKGALDSAGLAAALDDAEISATRGNAEVSDSNAEAIRFPIRFLRTALQTGEALDYQAITARIGRGREGASD